MKKTIKMVAFALMAVGMLACGGNEKKITEEDLKATERILSDERGVLNEEAVPGAVEQYCAFVKQSPNDPQAPEWLFKAMQVEVRVGASDEAIKLTEQLVKDYPEYVNTPVALFMLATNVYDGQLHNLDKARVTFERVINDYPDTQWASDAKVMIQMLGMTEEEMLDKIIPASEAEATE